jgi:hypothetical protein
LQLDLNEEANNGFSTPTNEFLNDIEGQSNKIDQSFNGVEFW